jgi:DNA-binding winged helix-turn-helix (wHTH) protein/Tol biopolymer transport system component
MSGQNQTVRFGPFELDIQVGELRKSDTRLKLQGQPIQILEMLLAKPGQLVTREEIQERLWPADTFVDFDHSLNTAIKKLRQALGDEADAPRYVETLPKRGYRFIGKVELEQLADAPFAPVASKVVSPEIKAALPADGMRHVLGGRVLAGCAIALTACAGVLVYLGSKPLPRPRITGSHPLVRNAYPKMWPSHPITDGTSVYFQEDRPSGVTTMQVPVTGGTESAIDAVKGNLQDISRDGSQLLFIAPDETQPNQTDVWSQPLPVGPPRQILKNAASPIWAEDGRGVFFVRNEKELCRASTDGTEIRRLAGCPNANFPTLSPDGTRIRYVEIDGTQLDMKIWEVGSDGTNPHVVLGGMGFVFGGTWSLDGRVFFFTAWDGDRNSLWAFADESSRWGGSLSPPQQLTFGPTSIGPPTISKDGRQIFAIGVEHQGELSVYDRASRKFLPYLGGISVCYVDFTRDGQWMTYVSYPEGTLWRSKVDGSDKLQLTSPPLAVMNPRWSPDGKLIVFTDLANGDRRHMSENTPRRMYVVSADGGAPNLLVAGSVADPTWSPDGHSIAYTRTSESGEPEIRIFDMQTLKSSEVPGSKSMWSPRWSPDGSHLVAFSGFSPSGASSKMMLFTWAANTWQELVASPNLAWDSWSHDGKFVYVQDGSSLVRINASSHAREQIASLSGFRGTAYYLDRFDGGWFGLSPDDRPITTRDTGIEGIYSFDLEYK